MRLGHLSQLSTLFAGLGLIQGCSSASSEGPNGQSGYPGYTLTQGGGGSNLGGMGTGNAVSGGNVPGVGGAAPSGQGGRAPGAGGAVGYGGALPGGGGSPPGGGGAQPGGGAPPVGGAGGESGGAPAGGNGGMSGGGGAAPIEKPPCLKDASQIVLIGDSYINWGTHTFPQDMNAVSMLNIGLYAVGGTSMGSGGIGLIPPQFDTALAAHPTIKVVIMDGGGNDVLLPDVAKFPQGGDCKMKGAMSPSIPDCQKIVQAALDAGVKLFLHMADKGVNDVMYFFYPHVPLNTVLGGTDPNGMLDYALPKIKEQCEKAWDTSYAANPQKPLRCHFIDTVPIFQGHNDYFAAGDVHENSTGSKAITAAIWAKMKTDCVGQPASSGCCTPQ
jgi:hypothetical protein